MPNSMNYSVFLNITPEPQLLFRFRQNPLLRPRIGDVLTEPSTFQEFKIVKDEIPNAEIQIRRQTDDGRNRITDNGDLRVTQRGSDPDETTHNYFVTPANNPNRISSWSRSDFDEDQTLKQLFR